MHSYMHDLICLPKGAMHASVSVNKQSVYEKAHMKF